MSGLSALDDCPLCWRTRQLTVGGGETHPHASMSCPIPLSSSRPSVVCLWVPRWPRCEAGSSDHEPLSPPPPSPLLGRESNRRSGGAQGGRDGAAHTGCRWTCAQPPGHWVPAGFFLCWRGPHRWGVQPASTFFPATSQLGRAPPRGGGQDIEWVVVLQGGVRPPSGRGVQTNSPPPSDGVWDPPGTQKKDSGAFVSKKNEKFGVCFD